MMRGPTYDAVAAALPGAAIEAIPLGARVLLGDGATLEVTAAKDGKRAVFSTSDGEAHALLCLNAATAAEAIADAIHAADGWAERLARQADDLRAQVDALDAKVASIRRAAGELRRGMQR